MIWSPPRPIKPYKPQGRPEAIILHHSEGPDSQTAREIWDYHTRAREAGGRGFIAIAYHWLVDRDGNIYEGRPEWAVGAHAASDAGSWNRRSISICAIGDYLTEWPPEMQQQGILQVISRISYHRGWLRILGHNEAMAELGDESPTDCPGVPWPASMRYRVSPWPTEG